MSVFSSNILRGVAAGAATVLFGFSAPAVAQESYPNAPIRLVVPFAPGGSTDLVGRLIAEHLGKRLGHSVVVENKAGAGGAVGAECIARSKADGYSLGMASVGTHGFNDAIDTDPTYTA